ncbi:MAG: homoserine kinase [Planctomycetaceae bacterium]
MRVTVRVPATSANLGPGFDCFGLALDLCNEVVLDTDAPPGVTWEGEGEDELPRDGSDLVSRTIAGVASGMELALPPFGLNGENRIPLERGLGSSSAATVAGVVLASRLLDLGIDGFREEPERRDPYSVFAYASRFEGHPDNAAPAAYGGFTIALPDGGVHRLDPHPDLRPVVLVPDVRLPTTEARAALPQTVARADAVFNAAHAALMVEALTRDPSLLVVALQDRLHQEARLALVPEVADVFDDLRAAHVPVCVSGAGPSLLAFDLGAGTFPSTPPGWRELRPGVRAAGFEVV